MQYIGAVIIGVFFLSIGDAFQDTLGWDAIQTIFAMAAMVPGAAFVADRLLHPATRIRFEKGPVFTISFLMFVSVFAFLLYSTGKTDFEIVESSFTRYAALWWIAFPYSCGMLVIADRAFDAFGGKKRAPKKADPIPAPSRWPFDSKPEGKDKIEFDPKRFR